MILRHLPFRLPQRRGRRKGLGDRLAADFARQTVIGTVARVAGLVAMATGTSATSTRARDLA
jgi:hypothetical protein